MFGSVLQDLSIRPNQPAARWSICSTLAILCSVKKLTFDSLMIHYNYILEFYSKLLQKFNNPILKDNIMFALKEIKTHNQRAWW